MMRPQYIHRYGLGVKRFWNITATDSAIMPNTKAIMSHCIGPEAVAAARFAVTMVRYSMPM